MRKGNDFEASELLNPFQDLEPVHLISATEAEAESTRISDILEGRSDWSMKESTIHYALQLLHGDVLVYSTFDIHRILHAISDTIIDKRMALVKAGLIFIIGAVRLMGITFVPSVEQVVKSLFKNVNVSSNLSTTRAKTTILEVVRAVPHKRTANAILAAQNEKNYQKRLIVVESIGVILTEWNRTDFPSLFMELDKKLIMFSNDQSSYVRDAVKRIMKLGEGPKQIPLTPRKLTSKIPKAPLLTSRSRKSLDRDNSFVLITRYMPPDSHSKADNFSRLLAGIVENNNLAQLDGLQDMLPTFIIQAAPLAPNFLKWDTTIPKLIENYQAEFKSQAAEVLLATNTPKRSFSAAMRVYGASFLYEQMLRLKNVSSLLIALLNNDFAVDSRVLKLVDDLLPEAQLNQLRHGFYNGMDLMEFIASDDFETWELSEFGFSKDHLRNFIAFETPRLIDSLSTTISDRVLTLLVDVAQEIDITPFTLALFKCHTFKSFALLEQIDIGVDLWMEILNDEVCVDWGLYFILNSKDKSMLSPELLGVIESFLDDRSVSIRRMASAIFHSKAAT